MAKFTDREGREWSLSITVGDLKPLREFGFDLGKITGSGKLLGEVLFGEPEKLVAVLFHLCERQADQRGVGPEDFAKGIDGSTLEQAGEAMVEAAIDFFPRSRVAREWKGRMKSLLATMDDMLVERISSVSPTNSPAASE